MAAKTYELNSRVDSKANIFFRVSEGKRSRLVKPRIWKPNLITTFMDENGKYITLRYKRNSSSVNLKEQIEKEGIPKDEPFSRMERQALIFKNGRLTTSDVNAQAYIENSPWMEGFKGKSDHVPFPVIKLVDKEADAEKENQSEVRILDAKLKVRSLNLADAQGLIIKLTGSYNGIPKKLVDCQNTLFRMIDTLNEDGINKVLSTTATQDEKVNVMVGKLVSHGVLSFSAISDAIARKDVAGKWISIKDIPSSYNHNQRVSYFVMHLTSTEGKDLLISLQESLDKIEKKEAKDVKENASDEAKPAKKGKSKEILKEV